MRRKYDLVGQVFGRLTALKISDRLEANGSRAFWDCMCECGNTKTVRTNHLHTGFVRSCGCFSIDRAPFKARTHGMTKTSVYRIWNNMGQRCNVAANPAYHNYGGRGIKVCERWQSFENFYADMGERPSNLHSLDRMNNHGDYEPENCQWAIRSEQNQNSRVSKYWIVNGAKFPALRLASKEYGVTEQTILRWCNGFFKRGQFIAPRNGCKSFLKYPMEA